ncbi:hypothetical protein [Vibrio agarivorans]|uniref:hypothetical protein n=1 Tax=Vibrio agarivorans TaxID=153622 RepID=UPI0025B4176C|nr:hypothetical protein [Vibrio agarivorans]MDN3662227.1 hypothetical protein [Vibrio agarivorans]
MKNLSMMALGLAVLTGCSSIDKLDAVEPKMTRSDLYETLGKPERIRFYSDKEELQYHLRESPHWWALTGCVALPAAIPIFGVMWISDGCLGEQKEVNVTLQESVVISTEVLSEKGS